MKFTVFMKCPDALSAAIDDRIRHHHATDDEKERMREVSSKFFQYGEYLKVEIDTDKETATVLRRDR